MNRRLDRISQHSFLPRYLSPRSVVLDLGYNLGAFALPMIERYGCRVVGVEPVPRLFRAAEASRPSELDLLHGAVCARRGPVSITVDPGRDLSATLLEGEMLASVFVDPDAMQSVEVTGLTLGDVMEKAAVDVIDLVKMDIEGAELEVLEVAPQEQLGRIRQITVEFHDYWYPPLAERTEAVKARLCACGFDIIRFTPNNKDVLFINRALVDVGWVERQWITHGLRNINGFGRMVKIPIRRTGLFE